MTALTPLETGEDGSQAVFSVVLESPPSLPVTIGVNSSDVSEGVVDKNTLNFNNSNWNTPQLVHVSGIDDGIADGDVEFDIELEMQTLDLLYAAIDPDDLTFTNLDDETGPPPGGPPRDGPPAADPPPIVPPGGLPGDGLPGSGLPGDGLPGDGLPGGGLPGGGLPGGGLPGDGLPGGVLPGGVLPGDGLPVGGLPGGGVLPGGALPGDVLPGDGPKDGPVGPLGAEQREHKLPKVVAPGEGHTLPVIPDASSRNVPPVAAHALAAARSSDAPTAASAAAAPAAAEEKLAGKSRPEPYVAGVAEAETIEAKEAAAEIQAIVGAVEQAAVEDLPVLSSGAAKFAVGSVSLGVIGWSLHSLWMFAATIPVSSSWAAFDPLHLLKESGAPKDESLKQLARSTTRQKEAK